MQSEKQPLTIPQVIENGPRGHHAVDIFSRLLNERVVFLNGPIHDGMSHIVVAQLLHLEAQDSTKPITMFINSPGGVVTAGLSIYDTMQFIRPPVATICMGTAMSMGSLLLASGEHGMRYSLPNSQILVHQPSGGSQGSAADIMIHTENTKRLKRRLNEIYVKHTGQPYSVVESTLERDRYMTPAEAVEWGHIDAIVTNRSELNAV